MAGPRHAPDHDGAGAAAVPDGWRPGPPDYVGVGTSGSGTAWWHGLIRQHPDVARLPGRPEALRFFDDGWQRSLDDDDLARYHAMFARPPGALAGEWTPDYLQQVWTPPLLRLTAPEARILVLLRDPVERFRDDLAGADEGSRRRQPTSRAAANAAFSRGLYADQLSRLWRAFPREQVLVLQSERCVIDPRRELERTFTFIGLSPEAAADIDPGHRGDAVTAAVPVVDDWQSEQLARHYAPELARLAALLPELDLSLWRAAR
jgi:hypothetical protein